jgi:hypothetical protein
MLCNLLPYLILHLHCPQRKPGIHSPLASTVCLLWIAHKCSHVTVMQHFVSGCLTEYSVYEVHPCCSIWFVPCDWLICLWLVIVTSVTIMCTCIGSLFWYSSGWLWTCHPLAPASGVLELRKHWVYRHASPCSALVFSSFGYMSQCGIVESNGNYMFNFSRNCPKCFPAIATFTTRDARAYRIISRLNFVK